MPGSPPIHRPREDFPAKRLAAKVLQANLVVFGCGYLFAVSQGVWQNLRWGNIETLAGLARSGVMGGQWFLDALASWYVTALFFVAGSFAGLMWYVIARQIETRKLKKRLGLLTKSCASSEPDVKSPHS